jgi:hypothetical protein
MDRVLMLRLQAVGCTAEVCLNDIPVGRVNAHSRTLCLPVHEFLLSGENAISLVIDPAPPGIATSLLKPKLADNALGASLRLLLPRVGHVGSEMHARTLADVQWAVADGDVYEAPLVISKSVSLPIKFPRWRWLDAPQVKDDESLKPVVTKFLQGLAIGMARGEFDVFLSASRLRLEELAQAYQQPVTDLSNRLLTRLKLLYATKSIKMVMPDVADITLRRCANGRLLECVGPAGEPALRTLPAPDGSRVAWPVRVAVVNGQCHILR